VPNLSKLDRGVHENLETPTFQKADAYFCRLSLFHLHTGTRRHEKQVDGQPTHLQLALMHSIFVILETVEKY
jgi:hypothetical protein